MLHRRKYKSPEFKKIILRIQSIFRRKLLGQEKCIQWFETHRRKSHRGNSHSNILKIINRAQTLPPKNYEKLQLSLWPKGNIAPKRRRKKKPRKLALLPVFRNGRFLMFIHFLKYKLGLEINWRLFENIMKRLSTWKGHRLLWVKICFAEYTSFPTRSLLLHDRLQIFSREVHCRKF